MHPYHDVICQMKRDAYLKIDDWLRGFEAPDYMREPAERQTYFDN